MHAWQKSDFSTHNLSWKLYANLRRHSNIIVILLTNKLSAWCLEKISFNWILLEKRGMHKTNPWDFSVQKIIFVSSLPMFHPIANRIEFTKFMIQLSVNFGVAISPRHECATTFTDIMPSYLVFLEYVTLIHKKLSDIQVLIQVNVRSKVMLMSVIECEC